MTPCPPEPLPMTSLLALALLAPSADDFAAKVRPLLASRCFKCHGPDDAARKARLRLDVREAALEVVVPGKPAESELVARIRSADPHKVMPPPSAKMPLTDPEKAVLEKWIKDGAAYARHWAFVAPKRPAVPKGGRHPIDSFLLARLAKEGLEPNPEADRATLARRISLDLVGIPPATAQLDAFLADARPDAWERFIDRLLASPAYGERWARKWLDLA
ncbi:MAG: DUF1549 domain-containing protein, partial [Gemmataceae bacterium]|nr:DUF1549 domain-containing protein [Gemmataceae bacterium]